MAYGNYAYNKVQLGREATAGTGVAATTIWRGPFAFPSDERERTVVEENIGLAVTAERTYTAMYGGMLSMPQTELTFEQFPHLLEAGVLTATPTGSGPYVYNYTLPTGNSINTIKSYTIEAFNNLIQGDHREMPYSFVEEFTIEGSASQAWMMSANWRGQRLVDTVPTSLSTLVTVNEALFPRTKLYIDDSGGTVGSTQMSGVLVGASMTVRTGWMPVPVGDGSLYFSTIKFIKPEVTFSITMELENTARAVEYARADYESEAVNLFRWGVTEDANHSFVLDFAGKYDSVGDYTDSEGNTHVTLEGHAVYSSTDSLFWDMTVTNELASLP